MQKMKHVKQGVFLIISALFLLILEPHGNPTAADTPVLDDARQRQELMEVALYCGSIFADGDRARI
jgi:hypothetical protein